MIRRVVRALCPRVVRVVGRAIWCIEYGYGHLRSVRTRRSIGVDGEPIPWYTYPALDQLKQWNLTDKSVFEYGCGGSTLFWAKRARSVESVEDDQEWFHRVSVEAPNNTKIRIAQTAEEYVGAIGLDGAPFDVIVIDGKHRAQCARASAPRLAPGGVIILDNAEWYSEAARILRDTGLLQVDFIGLAPINGYTHATSFFFDREFRVNSQNARPPVVSIGGVADLRE